MNMGRRVGVGLVVGLVLGACLERASPLASPIEGKVEIITTTALGPVELQLIPEEQLALFLQVSLPEARANFENAAFERTQLRTRSAQWQAESDRATDELARSNAEILQRRLEVVRRAVSVREMEAQRRQLTARGNAVRRRASEVQRQADAARRDWEAAEDAAQRLADGSFFLRALPLPLLTAHVEPEASFTADLPAGRYAVVATGAGPGRSTRVWLLWTRVEPGVRGSLELKLDNVALSECEACVLAPEHSVVNRY